MVSLLKQVWAHTGWFEELHADGAQGCSGLLPGGAQLSPSLSEMTFVPQGAVTGKQQLAPSGVYHPLSLAFVDFQSHFDVRCMHQGLHGAQESGKCAGRGLRCVIIMGLTFAINFH